jgi:hypothetical protein
MVDVSATRERLAYSEPIMRRGRSGRAGRLRREQENGRSVEQEKNDGRRLGNARTTCLF